MCHEGVRCHSTVSMTLFQHTICARNGYNLWFVVVGSRTS